MSVPIATSPGRSGFGPQLALSYDSGAGNGPFGFGWTLSLPSIARKTDKGLPQYRDADESDTFILSGAEDLVPVIKSNGDPLVDVPGYTIHCYRPRIEGLFARVERWTKVADASDVHWRSISRENILTIYGKDQNSRIADPADPRRIFSWLICETRDDKGNVVLYEYKPEDGSGVNVTRAHQHNRGDLNDPRRTANRYLKHIRYGNRESLLDDITGQRPRSLTAEQIQNADWMFEVVFDYGEHDPDAPVPSAARQWTYRVDPFSSYRAGFELRTGRLCQRVLMFHHFADELGIGEDCLVRSTDFTYSHDEDDEDDEDPDNARIPLYTFLRAVTETGYRRQNGGYLKRSLPPVEFEYAQPIVQDTVQDVDAASLENLPIGVVGPPYQWTDLHGEGIPGVLTEQAGAWLYKRNLSPISERPVEFAPLERVAAKPNLALAGGQAQFMDLAGDGQPDLVVLDGPMPGLYEHDGDEGWQPFRPFTSRLNRDTRNPNLKFVDLDGNGHADVLISEDDAFVWHPSLGEEGFGPAHRVHQALDEEKGPRLVFADGTQSIYLADLSGDGLTDLVRIRNREICYWPNHGYGRFGAKVTMDDAPQFDHPDQFDHRRLRLADIDGTGTTDIIYLHRGGVRLYFNQSGNSWSAPQPLRAFPQVDDLVDITVTDLRGNGTSCLVWSSPLPGDALRQMRYVDLMGGKKPHLLIKTVNNLGAETRVEYAPSTKFYLQDKRDGRPWITRLPFPVHVVERVETYDRISRNRFVTRYAYHHGYFDGDEREFRGFGMVEQWDTEEFAALSASGDFPTDESIDASSHVPPVLTRTWFHTGAYFGRHHVSDFFAGLLDENDIGEYYREPGLADAEARALLLPDTVLPAGLTLEEEREACRALKGTMLRQEIYALDGTLKAEHPYTVSEQNFTIRRLQPHDGNRHAVFFTHARESISYHYERNPADPRIAHALTLQVDDFGNVLKSAAVGYGRYEKIRVIDDQGRVSQIPNPALDALQPHDRKKQTDLLITYTENRLTNRIDDAAVHPGDYRTPLPCETRTYELTGIEPENNPARFSFGEWIRNGFALPTSAAEIPYEQTANHTNPQKRPIERVRTLYRPDDLGEAQNDPLALLPLGDVEPLALPGESYKLTFTPGLLDQVYVRSGQKLLPANAADILEGGGADRGGYVDLDGDDHWWIPASRVFHSPDSGDTPTQELTHARRHFFLPYRYRDPFHTNPVSTESFVTYDAYDLLMLDSRDPLGNRVTVGERKQNGDIDPDQPGNDYRVLQPRLVMDPNRNRSAVAFDALGMIVGTAVMGKPEDDPGGSDSLDGFVPDLTDAVVSAQLQNPLADPHPILQRATTRVVYDLQAYRRTKEQASPQPAVVHTLARETHDAALPSGQQTEIQHRFSYSDGFGREIQKKIRAEPGPVPRRDPATGRIIVVDGRPELTPHDVSPRWVGSGWTVVNNKGKPVRQYEPFFTDRHRFEFDVRIGVSPILFYDPVERVVATVHPNHTWEKVVFDPWRHETWDVNDTVTLQPQNDEDVKSFFVHTDGTPRLPEDEYLPTWRARRQGGALGPEEEAAASKAAIHANTPAVTHLDSLGRVFLTVAHNKFKLSDAPPAAPPSEEVHRSRITSDIEGNQREIIDASDRVVMRYDYDMLSNRIHQASMEAGERWTLSDVAGKPIRAWDSRGHTFRTVYDPLRRPLRSFVTGANPANPNEEVLSERLVYGEQHPQARSRNLHGRLYLHVDQAGAAINEAHDFKGNLISAVRRLVAEYKQVVSWSIVDDALPPDSETEFTLESLETALSSRLEADRFISHTRYDALDRTVQIIAPRSGQPNARRNVVQPRYNEANLLEGVDVWLNHPSEPVRLVDPGVTPPSQVGVHNIDYDAKGQRTLIEYKNGAASRYSYDYETLRLTHLYTRRDGSFTEDCGGDPPPPRTAAPDLPPQGTPCGLQNLHYTYDPGGNITHIRDDAQQTLYFRNKRVEPSAEYTYDALYRLIEATGREHLGQIGGAPIPHSYNDAPRVRRDWSANDGNALGTYDERYVYDAVGNILSMQHKGSDPAHPGWTRSYAYNETSQLEAAKLSNRLSSTTIGATTENYRYDGPAGLHGNITSMPQLQATEWDFKDQLRSTRRQAVNPGDDEGIQRQGERTYYSYDAGGQRVRKVTELATGQVKDERIYLGGFEIYRRRGANAVVRETLHVMDDQRRIALVETRTEGNDGSPPQLIRFQLGNHLGSASLELDQQAKIISYEEYTPYGSTSYQAVRSQTETSKRYRYTGKERDEESGLYYHGARYYVPWLGRWTAADPASLADGANLFAYGRGNPLRIIDPTGRQGIDWSAAEREAQMCIPEGPQVSYSQARSQASSAQRAFRQEFGITGRTIQAGHTMTVAESVTTRLPREVRDDPSTMMALHSRRRQTHPGREVDITEGGRTVQRTRHTGQEMLTSEERSRQRTGTARAGQVYASKAVRWRTQGTGWDEREARQILASPRRTEAERIESSPAVAEHRRRQASAASQTPSAPPRGGVSRMRPTGAFVSAAGGTAASLTRAVVPGVVEAEIALAGGAIYANAAGYTALGAALETGVVAVPVVGAGLVAGGVVGNLAEAGARELGASEAVAEGTGAFASMAAGAGVGALIGAPAGGIGAVPGAVIGGIAGLGGYYLSKLF